MPTDALVFQMLFLGDEVELQVYDGLSSLWSVKSDQGSPACGSPKFKTAVYWARVSVDDFLTAKAPDLYKLHQSSLCRPQAFQQNSISSNTACHLVRDQEAEDEDCRGANIEHASRGWSLGVYSGRKSLDVLTVSLAKTLSAMKISSVPHHSGEDRSSIEARNAPRHRDSLKWCSKTAGHKKKDGESLCVSGENISLDYAAGS
jgi:hypothetical protein